jgi:hypothetical protein
MAQNRKRIPKLTMNSQLQVLIAKPLILCMVAVPLVGCGSGPSSTNNLPLATRPATEETSASRLLISSDSVAPGQQVTLTLSNGAAFSTGPETLVLFSDGNGYEVSVLPTTLTPGSIGVVVPPYLDPTLDGLQSFRAGSVSVFVEQGGSRVGPVALNILELQATGLTPGVVVTELLSLLTTQQAEGDLQLQRIQAQSKELVDTSQLRTHLTALHALVADVRQQLQPLLDGTQTEITLQSLAGTAVVTLQDLETVDKVLYALLALGQQSALQSRAEQILSRRATAEERQAVRDALTASSINAIISSAGVVLALFGTHPVLRVAGVALFLTGILRQAHELYSAINQAERSKRREDWIRAKVFALFLVNDVERAVRQLRAISLKELRPRALTAPAIELLQNIIAALRALIASVDQHLDEFEVMPVARADRYSTLLNTPLQITAASGILNNDEVNQGTLAAIPSATTRGGAVQVSADGGLQYTPADFFFGTDSFSYTLSNSAGESTATVSIEVQPTLTGVWTEGGAVTSPGQCAGISDTAVMVLTESNGQVSGSLSYAVGGFTDPVTGSYNAQTRELVLVTQTFNSVLVGTVSPDLRTVSGVFQNGLPCFDREGNDLGATAGVWSASR